MHNLRWRKGRYGASCLRKGSLKSASSRSRFSLYGCHRTGKRRRIAFNQLHATCKSRISIKVLPDSRRSHERRDRFGIRYAKDNTR